MDSRKMSVVKVSLQAERVEVDMPDYFGEEQPVLLSAYRVVSVLRGAWEKDMDLRERFYAMASNAKNRLISVTCLSMGGITSTEVDMRILFRYLIQSGATAFIVAHNHPSGDLLPSKKDEELTEKLHEASKILGFHMLDSLIITSQSSYSIMHEQ